MKRTEEMKANFMKEVDVMKRALADNNKTNKDDNIKFNYRFVNLNYNNFIKRCNEKQQYEKTWKTIDSFCVVDCLENLLELITSDNVVVIDFHDFIGDVINISAKIHLKKQNLFALINIYDTLSPNRWDLFEFDNFTYVVRCAVSKNKKDFDGIDLKNYEEYGDEFFKEKYF